MTLSPRFAAPLALASLLIVTGCSTSTPENTAPDVPPQTQGQEEPVIEEDRVPLPQGDVVTTGDDRACGGMQGLRCEGDEYCAYEIDAMCGAADQMGRCEARPEACTQQMDPVCGCDDMTYPNACMAAMAGIAIASMGQCAGQDPGTPPM